jgi:hypothetical protein
MFHRGGTLLEFLDLLMKFSFGIYIQGLSA